jgi:hypothetical protein
MEAFLKVMLADFCYFLVAGFVGGGQLICSKHLGFKKGQLFETYCTIVHQIGLWVQFL